MCLIVEKKQGHVIRRDELTRWIISNADGWGIMSVADGQVQAAKGLGIEELWRTLESNRHREYYLHLRMATHGDVSDANTHPLLITRGVWLMHNGIVGINTLDAPEKSDTVHWVEKVLRPLLDLVPDASEAIRSPWFRVMVESYGGLSNRFVFMDVQGAVTFNDEAWHELPSGMRVSNTYALGDFVHSTGNLYGPAVLPLALSAPGYIEPWIREDHKRTWEDDPDTGYTTGGIADACMEDDFRQLIGAEYSDVEEFTYSYPERAAAVLHMLVSEADCR